MENRCENCIIRQFNSLRALNKDDLKKVSDSKISRKIKKGEALFVEGQKLDGVFCVRNGVSKLSKLSANGKEQIVKLTNIGEIMGQRSVIAEDFTNLSATAINDMEVCFIPKEIISNTLNTNPNFSLEVLRHLAHDLKEADDVIVNMSQKTVKQRLAEAFIYLKKNYGEDENGFLTLTLSRDDYANIIGAATESLIRMISDFKKKGLIKTEGKKIGVVEIDRLQELVDGF
ncbi:Crp/Fnr family transcriptional regulator [Maribacter sp. M208]|uniref:Crp/Fnr family transcriptional regulator n=1 Tax=Maribacter huludaoensis TaxID=3030010 RepID=UPI0023EBFD4E|nr:Crp/Fnr family transcriptional regulator [Maribacter huludaoensis]MDF4222702.1 Crp/Fnr family transcriptional regulator [Maribacter huludaoensis]